MCVFSVTVYQVYQNYALPPCSFFANKYPELRNLVADTKNVNLKVSLIHTVDDDV